MGHWTGVEYWSITHSHRERNRSQLLSIQGQVMSLELKLLKVCWIQPWQIPIRKGIRKSFQLTLERLSFWWQSLTLEWDTWHSFLYQCRYCTHYIHHQNITAEAAHTSILYDCLLSHLLYIYIYWTWMNWKRFMFLLLYISRALLICSYDTPLGCVWFPCLTSVM